MTTQITWLVATDYYGCESIVSEAVAASTRASFEAKARREGKITREVTTPYNKHWDGSSLSSKEIERIQRGISRNACDYCE